MSESSLSLPREGGEGRTFKGEATRRPRVQVRRERASVVLRLGSQIHLQLVLDYPHKQATKVAAVCFCVWSHYGRLTGSFTSRDCSQRQTANGSQDGHLA